MSAEAARLAWALGRARAQTLALVDDVPAGVVCHQSIAAEHHPAWIVGHLVLADVYLLHLLGVDELADDFPALLAQYGPLSAASAAKTGVERFAPLVERLRATGVGRDRAVALLTAADLVRTTPDPMLARAQPTLAHHLHALVNHEGYHAGELTAWRRARGLRPVRWSFSPAGL